MTYEREDYMRRQEAEHDMIRMREPRSNRQFSTHPDPRDEIIADLVAALRLLVGEELCGDARSDHKSHEAYRTYITWADRAFARAILAKATGK